MNKQILAKFEYDDKTIELSYNQEYENYQVIFSGMFDNKPSDMSAGRQKHLAINYFNLNIKSACVDLLGSVGK